MYKDDIVLFALQTHAPLLEDVVADHPLATVAEAKGFRAHEVEHAPLLHQAITKQALSASVDTTHAVASNFERCSGLKHVF